MSLDATDQRLVKELTADGRATIRGLSEVVGLPESTTRDRIRSLEERGIIDAYQTRVDPDKVGLHLVAWVFMDVKHQDSAEFAEFVNRQPAVIRGNALQHKPGAFAIKVAAPSSQELTKTLQQWTQRFDVQVRDLLLVDDVRAPAPGLPSKEDTSMVLGALSEKY